MQNDDGLIDLLLLVDRVFAWSAVDEEQEATDDREDLEEVVLGEVLVWVGLVELNLVSTFLFWLQRWETYGPEVVNQKVEHAQNNNKHGSGELGLESNNNHNASHGSNSSNNDPPNGPRSREHKAHEQEDQEHTTSKLEVHLAILLIDLWEPGKRLCLANPGVREHHQEAAHDGQVAKEKVQVKDQTVAQSLCDDDANESSDCVVGVLAGDDEDRAGSHGDYVEEEEAMVEAGWD